MRVCTEKSSTAILLSIEESLERGRVRGKPGRHLGFKWLFVQEHLPPSHKPGFGSRPAED